MGIFLFCILVICIISSIAYFTFRFRHSNVEIQSALLDESVLLDVCRLKREQIEENIRSIELENEIGHLSKSEIKSRVNYLKKLIDKIIKLEKSFPKELKDLNIELNHFFLNYERQKEAERD